MRACRWLAAWRSGAGWLADRSSPEGRGHPARLRPEASKSRHRRRRSMPGHRCPARGRSGRGHASSPCRHPPRPAGANNAPIAARGGCGGRSVSARRGGLFKAIVFLSSGKVRPGLHEVRRMRERSPPCPRHLFSLARSRHRARLGPQTRRRAKGAACGRQLRQSMRWRRARPEPGQPPSQMAA